MLQCLLEPEEEEKDCNRSQVFREPQAKDLLQLWSLGNIQHCFLLCFQQQHLSIRRCSESIFPEKESADLQQVTLLLYSTNQWRWFQKLEALTAQSETQTKKPNDKSVKLSKAQSSKTLHPRPNKLSEGT